MRSKGITWIKIAKFLESSKSALQRWRQEVGFIDPLREIENAELDEIIFNYVTANDRRGERMVMGLMNSMGISVTRDRIRDSINRVDPDGRQQRKKIKIPRRDYNVRGPNHLWHIDGNHKLKPSGLIIHGGIDGFSRKIVFLRCVDNNRAATMLDAFMAGVREEGGVPSRVRGDRGGENVDVARFMTTTRGLGRSSFIVGPSTRNQRIERLWRDVTERVTSTYKSFFVSLEKDDGLNMADNNILFLLHYLFLPRINADLDQFREAWNHHKLSSERNATPVQLMLLHSQEDGLLQVDEDEYGVDGDPGVADEGDDAVAVVVIPPTNPMTAEQTAVFTQNVACLNLQESVDTFYDRFHHAHFELQNILN